MADKLTDAARFYKGLKEQTDAFNWLETTIPADKLKEFFVKYRTNASAQDTYTNDWDGPHDKSGNKLPDGTYYYIIRTDNNEYTGAVTIKR